MPGALVRKLRELGFKCIPMGRSLVQREDPPQSQARPRDVDNIPIMNLDVDNIPIMNLEFINRVSADKGCSSRALLRVDSVSAVEVGQTADSKMKMAHVLLDVKMSDLKAVNSSPFRTVSKTSRAVRKTSPASPLSAGRKEGKTLAMAQLSPVSYLVEDPTRSLPIAQYVEALSFSLEGQTPLAGVISTVTQSLLFGNAKEAVSNTPHPGTILPPRSLESSSDYVSTIVSACWLSSPGMEGTDTLVPAILLFHFNRPDISHSRSDNFSMQAPTTPDPSSHSQPRGLGPLAEKEDLLSHVPAVISVVNFEGQV
jgi:hypothetical protein